ncbi:hypothetical protein [Mycolicibacter virginiensis]|nr:hypothetical protein [Mycolicibacter virginiensis]UVI51745.1 hypothetical protein MJO54_23655 [Mycolicibacter virginiensis]
MTDPDPDRDAAQADRPRHAQTVVLDLATMVATPVGEYANRNSDK